MGKHSRATGALLGLAGGVAGLLAMRYVMKGTGRLLGAGDSRPRRRASMSLVGEQRRRGENATTAAGRIVFTTVMRREPSRREKELMGQALHWSYALAMAAGYGMLRGHARRGAADLVGGALFGLGLWGLMDEVAVPLLGLGDRPTAYPMKKHAQALAGHIGYGVATAATVQGLHRLLGTLSERQRRGQGLHPSRNAKDFRERLAARFR